jgi:hypothetical protein
MKTHLFEKHAAACGLVLTSIASVHALASDNSGLSRAQVQQDLATYRCAGFNPVADEITYPADVEAVQARVAKGEGCAVIRRPPKAPHVRDSGQSR